MGVFFDAVGGSRRADGQNCMGERPLLSSPVHKVASLRVKSDYVPQGCQRVQSISSVVPPCSQYAQPNLNPKLWTKKGTAAWLF